MKKLSLLFAALLTATVMNLSAATAGKAPDMHDFLYFVGLNGNDTVKLNKYGNAKEVGNLTATFEYSKDRINWTPYDTWASNAEPKNTYQGNAIPLAKGDTVFFRALGAKKDGKNATLSTGTSVYYNFVFGVDDQIAAGGNTMSLYDAECKQDTMTDYGFVCLFKGAKQLLTAPKVPAKTLKQCCYRNMFRDCSLVDAPKLPATTLQTQCYFSMFCGCSSLVKAPALPAKNLAKSCYYGMFQDCTALTQAPELKATTLAEMCYNGMFQGCTSLTQAPELKATTLAVQCYTYMFNGCTSLEVNSFSGSCDGAELVVPTVSGTAPTDWNKDMFTGCQGDAALTAETGIQLGGHYCIKEYKDTNDYLHFVSLKENGTVKLNKVGMFYNTLAANIQYSMDRKAWTDYSWNAKEGTAIALAEGDTVFFRAGGSGLNTAFSTSVNSYFRFVFGDNDSIAAGGNIMSLYDASCEKISMTSYGFYKLFYGCDALVSAPKMPATTLDTYCYQSMFQGCAGLQSVPEKLPATMLASCCYHSMFSKCTSLTSAPALPATTLASGCYTNMFNGCSALTQAPELKATSLTASCYYAMFKQCTSLAEIPALEAETLATFCYYQMFSGCSQFEVSALSGTCEGVELTLPVPTELTDTCIQGMFDGCHIKDSIQFGGSYCIKEYVEPIYTRNVTNGNFGTICLDRKFTATEGVEGLFVPYEKTATMLYCEEVEMKDVVAGGAYIFKADSDVVVFTMEGEAVPAPVVEEGDYMIGWLGDTTNVDAAFLATYGDYSFLASNAIVKPEAGSTLLPNRAMIDLNSVPAKAAAPARGRLISFSLNDVNTPTGMESATYNLQPATSKLLRNGQLVIIRDGKMFNAQGQEL